MKRFFFLLGLALFGIVLSGCNSAHNATVDASLDSQFVLSPGQSASIPTESMNIKFIGVTQDSRCPTGVQCVQAGNVSCNVEITQYGTANRVLLTEAGGPGASQAYASQNYTLVFNISPYPEAGKTISKKDYRLSMTISKLGQ